MDLDESRQRQKKYGRKSRVWRRQAKETTRRPVPDTSPVMIDFMRFLKARGFINSTALQPVLYEGLGRGLRSKKRSFDAEGIIMSLPLNCLLMASEIRKSNPELYLQARMDEEVLAHYLYSQRRAMDRGEATEWAPYIRSLPQNYDWLPVAPLISDLIFGKVHDHRHLPSDFKMLLQDYPDNFCSVFQGVQHLLAWNNANPEQLDMNLFRWVFDVMNTRSLCINDDGKDDVALVPFFDLINHCPFANVTTRVCRKQGAFQVITHDPVKRGAQIFINYNNQETNREFFIIYGFIHLPAVPERLLSVPDIGFALVPSPMDFFKIRLNELEMLSKNLERMFERTHLPPPPCYLAAAHRILKRMGQVLRKVNLFQQQPKFDLGWPCQLSSRNEQYVVSLKKDGSYTVYDRDNCSPLPDQPTYCRYISCMLDILLWLLSTRHPPTEEEKALNRQFQKMAHKFNANPNAEGPLGELSQAEERLMYYHLQLLLVEWLLRSRFNSKQMDWDQQGWEQQSRSNLVELLQGRYLVSLLQAPEMPAQLAQLFTNEMALLLFTRRRLREKCHRLMKGLEPNGRDGLLECTCVP